MGPYIENQNMCIVTISIYRILSYCQTGVFKVIQGHRYWYLQKACQRCLLWWASLCYLQPFWRYRVL